MEESGQPEEDEALLAAWDALHPPEEAPGQTSVPGARAMSAAEAVRKMPYDLSPARLRSMELAVRLGASSDSVP
jgi:hypothetical protein